MGGIWTIYNLTNIYWIALIIISILLFAVSLVFVIKYRNKVALLAAIGFLLLCIEYVIRLLRHYYIDPSIYKNTNPNTYLLSGILFNCLDQIIILAAILFLMIAFWRLFRRETSKKNT
jgi:hypothetical protein